MKTNLKFALMIIFAIFITGCDQEDQTNEQGQNLEMDPTGDIMNNEYPQAQAEVLETFGAIAASITAGAGHGYDGEYMDQLISFHAYGDKFVEFNGGLSFDSAGNEHNERQLFGEDIVVGGVTKFAPIDGTLKVAVYHGNVANLTFISDFHLTHRDYGPIIVNNLITLLFVKTKGEWKMVHEHHSPVN